MSVEKELVILAITKMHGGICTAGLDEQRKWIRPVRPTLRRVREYETITDYCLLPMDYFHEGRSHLISGAVTRFWLTPIMPPDSPHIEDWTLDSQRSLQYLHKLPHDEYAALLASNCEQDLSRLLPKKERSLGLFQPEDFQFTFRMNPAGTDITVRTDFTLQNQQYNDISCTDLKMRALGRKRLNKSSGNVCQLTRYDFRQRGKEVTYLALGLSRLYKEKHWLIVVGVHTVPELEVEIDYSRL